MADDTVVDLDGTDKLDVRVDDDTPPADKNRTPLPKELVEDLEKDTLEEYSEKVKNRINVARKAFHDERREKEAAKREREEALRFAQQIHEENKQLKQRLIAGEKVFKTETTSAAETQVSAAKDALKRAYESGDASLITDAQEALTDAKIKLKEVSSFKPSLQEENSSVQSTQQVQTPRPAPVDRKADEWRAENTWFGVDEEMTALALGLHEKLVRSGVDPKSDEYYETIDKTMKKRFSDYFEGETQATEDPEPKPAPRKVSTVVAPASRSTAPRQVRIKASEAAIAKRLGLTVEAYAREKMKLENRNG